MTTLLICGCLTQSLPIAGTHAPEQNVVRASQYAFTTDFELDRRDPIVLDLVGLRDVFNDMLRLPGARDLVRVVIFENQERYEEFLKANYPELPSRRAFFLKQGPNQLVVVACRGKRLMEDLRHEATHALLHSNIADVPIWLDEGLAGYFEVGPEKQGLNDRHVLRLRSRSEESSFDLQRLESLRNLWQMTSDDYRESWLWVHYCLHHSEQTRGAFLAHLQALRRGEEDSLTARLAEVQGDLREPLRLHLAQLTPLVGASESETPDSYYEVRHSIWLAPFRATRRLIAP